MPMMAMTTSNYTSVNAPDLRWESGLSMGDLSASITRAAVISSRMAVPNSENA